MQSPGVYIEQVWANVEENISNTDYSIDALYSEFTDLSYFQECFKKMFGVNPPEYTTYSNNKI